MNAHTTAEQFSIDPTTGEASLVIQRPGANDPIKLSGKEALYNTTAPYLKDFQRNNPIGYAQFAYNTANSGIGYQIGEMLRATSPKTILGRAFDNSTNSPATQAGIGGLVGAGIGGLAGYLSDAVFDTNVGSSIPAALGAGLVGLAGYLRNKAKHGRRGFTKSSAMYSNPRNVILEKLQASTATPSEKFKLAEKVKNLSDADALELKEAVKESLTFDEAADAIGNFMTGLDWKIQLTNSMLTALCDNIFSQPTTVTKSDTMDEDGYNLGACIAALACGTTKDALNKAASMEKIASNNLQTQVDICKAASAMLEKGGATHTAEYKLLKSLATNPQAYHPALVKTAAEAAATAIGKELILEKKADIVGSSLGFITDAAGLALKTLAAASLIGGAGLGALSWKLGRDTKTVNVEAEAKREQAKYYKELARDIKKQMRAKAIEDAEREYAEGVFGPTTGKARNAIKSIAKSDTNYVL